MQWGLTRTPCYVSSYAGAMPGLRWLRSVIAQWESPSRSTSPEEAAAWPAALMLTVSCGSEAAGAGAETGAAVGAWVAMAAGADWMGPITDKLIVLFLLPVHRLAGWRLQSVGCI